MRHGRNSAYGRKERRERALERLQKTKFTAKLIKGKQRNEKSWEQKKEDQIKILEARIRGAS